MNLHPIHPTLYYSLFFSLSHLVVWGILFYHGYKHRYPLIQWLLIIATGFIFFTVGTHVMAVDVKDFFIHGTWPISKGKSLISGLLLAVPCLLFIRRLLKFNYDVFRPYAFAVPLGIAIQRFGCFFGGCCYGKITDVPWGVSYSHGYSAHFAQWERGIISASDFACHTVHPVQIYESILCMAAFILIMIISKKSWFRGPLIYVSLLFYAIIRFITEFFRAPEAHTIGINSYWSLNTVQWILIFSALISLYILLHNNKIKPQPMFRSGERAGLLEYTWYLALFALILITPGFYSSLERLLLGLLFIPLTALVFWEFFKSITIPKLRMASASLCVVGIFLMSQNSPISIEDTENKSNKYHEISIGGYTGSNSFTHYTEDCEGNKFKDYKFKENYYLMGLGYKYVNEIDDDKKFTIGIGASYGKLKEQVVDLNYTYTQDIYMFSPYVKYDLRIIGFGGGLLAGDISLFGPYDSNKPFTVFRRYSVLPQAHLRIGNLQKVWGEYNYGYRFPGIAPANEYEILLGFRGQKGNLVRIGTAAYSGLVIYPEFFINDKFVIEPYLGLLGPMFSDSYTDNTGIQGGVNLHYRIQK